jgi:hypothetical protein
LQFWGERFYPALHHEKHKHEATLLVPVLEKEIA